MELKRDYSSGSLSARSKGKGSKGGHKSLFDEYQYFTPGLYPCQYSLAALYSDCSIGLFMGFMASFLCLVILYIAISAVTSLEVPYAAFEKDTSAAAQKKQQ